MTGTDVREVRRHGALAVTHVGRRDGLFTCGALIGWYAGITTITGHRRETAVSGRRADEGEAASRRPDQP